MNAKHGFRCFVHVITLMAPLICAPVTTYSENLVKIYDSALSNMARVTGPLNGSGYHVTTVPYPCFQCTNYTDTLFGRICTKGEMRTCKWDAYAANYNWEISGVQFHIKTSGITYTGTLSAAYGPLRISNPISGTGTISLSPTTAVVNFPIVNIPLTFDLPPVNIPVIGRVNVPPVTVHTVQIAQPYRIAVPIGYVQISGKSEGVEKTILGRVLDPTFELKDGVIILSANAYFW